MVTIAMKKCTARYLLAEIDDGKYCLFSYISIPKSIPIDIKIFNNNADQGDSKLYFLQIAPTPRECCEDSSVPEFCLGLCSPADASARQENRITFCSKYDTIIEKCFQSAEGKRQGDQLF